MRVRRSRSGPTSMDNYWFASKKELMPAPRSAKVVPMRHCDDYTDRPWRKSRLAARILLRKAAGHSSARDQRLARMLAEDQEVTDRLIQQGLYFLGIGTRKHELDRQLGLGDRNN